jgi:hypothetical protein
MSYKIRASEYLQQFTSLEGSQDIEDDVGYTQLTERESSAPAKVELSHLKNASEDGITQLVPERRSKWDKSHAIPKVETKNLIYAICPPQPVAVFRGVLLLF